MLLDVRLCGILGGVSLIMKDRPDGYVSVYYQQTYLNKPGMKIETVDVP